MNSVSEKKAVLRQEYLQLRQSLSVEQWREWSAEITKHALDLPALGKARDVLCYVSSKDQEVNTLELIQALLVRGCRVAVPRMLPDVRLEWRCVADISQLSRARFGILEPKEEACPLFEYPACAEVCIVPGIAWDLAGHRIGYGVGFFDRFLSVFNGTTVGLAFESQLIDRVPHESHDIPVAHLITEKRVIKTRHS